MANEIRLWKIVKAMHAGQKSSLNKLYLRLNQNAWNITSIFYKRKVVFTVQKYNTERYN